MVYPHVSLTFLHPDPHFFIFHRRKKWNSEARKSKCIMWPKMWGRSEGERERITWLKRPVHRSWRGVMWVCEGKIEKTFFLVRIRHAYWWIRNAYWEITQGYDETTLGINSSEESVGFGLSVRAVRTGSPSGRTMLSCPIKNKGAPKRMLLWLW